LLTEFAVSEYRLPIDSSSLPVQTGSSVNDGKFRVDDLRNTVSIVELESRKGQRYIRPSMLIDSPKFPLFGEVGFGCMIQRRFEKAKILK
jgi:hypothetical protein